MKEFWMTLGCFFSLVNGPRSFAFGVTDHSPRENSSSVLIHVHDNVGTIARMSSPKNTVAQWTSATTSLLQTTKRVNRKTIIASNNKANEFSVTVTILPSLSTFFVAKTQIHEVENSALSTNVPPESLATKYSSLNIPNDLFSAKEIKEHSLAVSSNTSVMTPEIASTTSTSVTGNGIILPPSSVDKRYLSSSQTGDNFNADNSQGAFTKSAFSDVHRERLKSAQTAQFSSSNSILGQISAACDSSALANDGSRLFTKGSVTLTKLPRTFLLSSRTIWKTTELNPRRDETTLLFSAKADTSQSYNTRYDTTMNTAIKTTRKFPSISGMSQTTLVAKMTPDENDFSSTIFPPSRATQMVTSSVVHSAIQREIQSSISSVVLASPSASSNTRRPFSQSSSTTMTISATPMIQQPVTSRINSEFSSKPENEFRTLANSYNEEIHVSSRMSSTSTVISNNSRDSTSDSATKDTASISINKTTISIPQGTISLSDVSTSTLAEKTPSWAVADIQTQSLYSKTGGASSEMSFVDSTKTLIVETSTNVKPSLEAPGNLSSLSLSSTKSDAMTEWLMQSIVRSTDWISFTSSDNFSGMNTNNYRQSQISRSSSGIDGHEIRFSSTQISAVTRNVTLAAPSASYWESRSQIPHMGSSPATASYHQPQISKSTSEIGHQIHFSSSQHEVMSTEIPLSSSQNPVMSTELVVPISSHMKSSSMIPPRSSDVISSYHQSQMSKSISEIRHQINFSSQNPVISAELVVPTSSHVESSSQLPQKRGSVVTSSYQHSRMSTSTSEVGHHIHFSSSLNAVMSTELVAPSSSHMKRRSQIPHQRSSTVSENQNFSPSLRFTVTAVLDKSTLQTSSSAVSATPSRREEFTSEIIVPLPDESATSYTAASSQLGATVIPTQITSPSAPATGNVSTQSPTTAAADTGHIKLLIVVAIVPSILLCVFFVAFLFFRQNRKRKNKAVYSIKLEYADENNGFRKRCVNSRLDLSLKGIHIDLEFPNTSSDRERRAASYARDSASFSRGSNLSETQMRELQILSQECKENMEWISEVIAREMEASICGRPVNRDSVYSVKEKENYEPSEKVIRRESSKRGRETVKWRVPVVQRRDSDDFDQRDSMCTDDTTLFPEDWKEKPRPEKSQPHNGTKDHTKTHQQNSNPPVKENGDEVNLDKELRVQLSNKKLDELQSQEKDKKEKELEENIPLTVNLNPKKEDTSRVTQVKRASSRPRRFETL